MPKKKHKRPRSIISNVFANYSLKPKINSKLLPFMTKSSTHNAINKISYLVKVVVIIESMHLETLE